jgi:predicted nucleic acid-binding protein
VLVGCDEQLDDFRRVNRYDKVRAYIEPAAAGTLLRELRKVAQRTGKLPKVKRSPDAGDDYLLALAQVADADYMVTADRSGLLALKRHGKTRIVTARQFFTATTPKPRPRTRSRWHSASDPPVPPLPRSQRCGHVPGFILTIAFRDTAPSSSRERGFYTAAHVRSRERLGALAARGGGRNCGDLNGRERPKADMAPSPKRPLNVRDDRRAPSTGDSRAGTAFVSIAVLGGDSPLDF